VVSAPAGETTLYYHNYNWQVLAEYDGSNNLQRKFIYGNGTESPQWRIDEVLLMKAGENDYYYAHDHLYSPAALIDSSGTVLERYEYDAYGNCSILEPNFAPDPDGKSDYENPYYFDGKPLDLLDNGGLELMVWPYRNYSTYLGRWYQPDKLGMIPNDNKEINPLDLMYQYTDGMNLYEYVSSNPVNRVDPFGLWKSDMHYDETSRLAKKIGFKGLCAAKIAGANQGVDDLTPATNNAYQRYHFNGKTGILGDFIPYKPGRDEIANTRWEDAQDLLKKKGCNVYPALYLVGQALHGFQDAYSHSVSHHADTAWKHVTGPNQWPFWHSRPDKRSKWLKDWTATSINTQSALQAIWADPKVQCICKKK